MGAANESASVEHLLELGYEDPLAVAERSRCAAAALDEALAQARSLLGEGSATQAIVVLLSAQESAPDSPERRHLLAHALAQADRLDEAFEELRWLELHGYENAEFALLRARIALKQRKLHMAADQAEYARCLKSPNLQADLISGHAAFRLGDLTAAEAAFGRVIAAEPGGAAALAGLATVRLRQGALEASVDLALQALEAAPQLGTVHYRLGLALLGLGRREAATAAFAAAAQLCPHLAGPHRQLAEMHAGVDDAKAAEHRERARATVAARREARRATR